MNRKRPASHYLIDLAIVIMVAGLMVFANAVVNPDTSAAAPAPRACAFISNVTNTAAWTINGQTTRAKYTDYGDNLGYDKPVPRAAWAALNRATYKLTHRYDANGDNVRGPAIARACV